MCFAPQRGAVSPYHNFQKSCRLLPLLCSALCFRPWWRVRFLHLNFPNGANPTCVAIFYFKMCFAPQGRFFDTSTSIHARSPIFLATLTSQSALRHTGLQCFISYLASQLRREPFFPTAGATELWKAYFFAMSVPFPVPAFSFFGVSPSLTSDLVFSQLIISMPYILARCPAFSFFHIVARSDSKHWSVSNQEIFFVPKFLAVRCISDKWEVARALLLLW